MCVPSEKVNMWTLEEALILIRRAQPLFRPFDFHLALGGGVLNTGRSSNDLDIYILPVFKNRPYNWPAIEQLVYETFGYHEDLTKTSEGPTGREGPTYKYQWRCKNGDKVIDVFVGDPEPQPKVEKVF